MHEASARKAAVIFPEGTRFSLEVADTRVKQARGLSLRDQIGEREAMLFPFHPQETPAFWMKDMRFPIDIFWIRGDEIVAIDRAVPPQPGVSNSELTRYYPPEPVDYVLETRAGTADLLGIRPRQSIRILLP